MPRQLKVYRTPIGFHDAYVAALSQKAALAAWGSDANLFARGVAEQVDDPALTEEPLAHPGEVIRRLRGSADEHLAALPPDPPRTKKRPVAEKPKSRAPRPSREALDAAEAAVARAQAAHAEAQRALDDRERALRREREALEKEQRREASTLRERRDDAEAAYRAALDAWEP